MCLINNALRQNPVYKIVNYQISLTYREKQFNNFIRKDKIIF